MDTHEVFCMVQTGQRFENFKVSLPLNQLLDTINDIKKEADDFCKISEDVYDKGEDEADEVIRFFVHDGSDNIIGYVEHYETMK